MTITYHTDVIQYSPEWTAVKCGVLSASKMDKIITAKKLQFSQSEATQDFADELACQRVIREIDPTFQNYDMRRGLREEKIGRAMYSAHYAPVTECGFITNDRWGFKIGCSPAAAAMQEYLAWSSEKVTTTEQMANWAYSMADEMLKARGE